jgi:hypothetical protein
MDQQNSLEAEKARRFEDLVRQAERALMARGRRFGRPEDPPDTLFSPWSGDTVTPTSTTTPPDDTGTTEPGGLSTGNTPTK